MTERELTVPLEDWWYPGIPVMEEVEDLPLWLNWARLRQCDVLLRAGVSSPAIAWMDRALIEDFRGRPAGFAESCPTCWRPILAAPGRTSNLTGRAGCSCGPSYRPDPHSTHGIPFEAIRLFTASRDGRRAAD